MLTSSARTRGLFFGLIATSWACNQAKQAPKSEVEASPHGHQAVDLYDQQDTWPGSCQRSGDVDQQQSPIALTSKLFSGARTEGVKFAYLPADADIVDNGHTIKFNFKGEAGSMQWEGKTYKLQQFHFHMSAEHSIDGKLGEMEVHFVHMHTPTDPNQKPHAIALGFVANHGASSKDWIGLWSKLPAAAPKSAHSGEAHKEKVLGTVSKLNVRGLIPHGASYMAYEGSLTTPTCDEIVTHLVAQKSIVFDKKDIERFAAHYKRNNRSIQPHGDAKIRRYRLAHEK